MSNNDAYAWNGLIAEMYTRDEYDSCDFGGVSWKYKLIQKCVIGNKELELYEYCGKYHVRVLDLSTRQCVDIYSGESNGKANSVYVNMKGLLDD